MVKNFIRSGNIEGKIVKDLYGNAQTPLRSLDKKALAPTEEEIAANTRARSAKMRCAIKTATR
jgi:16S rRNA (cytosine1402-N4)-methyltransferase